MTPEWSHRAGHVLQDSPYWKDIKEGDLDALYQRTDEFVEVQHAVQESDSYDDLEGDAKELFDKAEAALKKAQEEYAAGAAERTRLAQADEADYWTERNSWS